MKLSVVYVKQHRNISLRRFLCNHPLRFGINPITEDLNKQLEEILVFIAPVVGIEEIIIIDEEHDQGYSLDSDEIESVNTRIVQERESMRKNYGHLIPPFVTKHANQQPVKYTSQSSDLVLVERDKLITRPMSW